MTTFVRYLKDYCREIKVKNFLLTSLFISLLVWLNYTIGIEKWIKQISPWILSLFSFFIFYLIVFGFA